MCCIRRVMALACLLLLVSQASFAQQWKLVWSDEFDKDGAPDPSKWNYEEGFVRNNEAQYYTRGRRENARVEKGMLVIEGRREKFPNARYRAGARGRRGQEFADYTAASLTTRNKASWTYGRIEVRAKIPHGRGVWPAIWMLGNAGGWPAGGEIDIMEFVGHTPDTIHGTVHFSKAGRHASSGGRIVAGRPYDDFHIYAVEWFPDRMDFYFDKQKYFTFPLSKADENGSNAFRKPEYLLLNFAIGGSWGGKIDETIWPQKYLIDYVRVYQQAPEK